MTYKKRPREKKMKRKRTVNKKENNRKNPKNIKGTRQETDKQKNEGNCERKEKGT